MNETVAVLQRKLRDLESQIERELEGYREKFHYTVNKKRVEFEATVKAHHKEMRISVARFLGKSGVIRILAALTIYVLVVPLILLDLAVTLFQFVCFPIYGITKVPREDFIALDRHHLAYLNPIEKINCAYCGYANGLLAYAREIAGRTEEHWCPIKHARRVKGLHRAYYDFAEYGDAEGYRARYEDDGKKDDKQS